MRATNQWRDGNKFSPRTGEKARLSFGPEPGKSGPRRVNRHLEKGGPRGRVSASTVVRIIKHGTLNGASRPEAAVEGQPCQVRTSPNAARAACLGKTSTIGWSHKRSTARSTVKVERIEDFLARVATCAIKSGNWRGRGRERCSGGSLRAAVDGILVFAGTPQRFKG